MRSDLSQTTHQFIPKDTLGGILFLRLKVSHLCPEDRVLHGGNDVLMYLTTELFSKTRDQKRNFEVLEGLPESKDRFVCYGTINRQLNKRLVIHECRCDER